MRLAVEADKISETNESSGLCVVTEEVPREHPKMRPFVGAVGFLVYFAITLEMIFMVTPFALYYYSASTPWLAAASPARGRACVSTFLFAHRSSEGLPSLGGL